MDTESFADKLKKYVLDIQYVLKQTWKQKESIYLSLRRAFKHLNYKL